MGNKYPSFTLFPPSDLRLPLPGAKLQRRQRPRERLLSQRWPNRRERVKIPTQLLNSQTLCFFFSQGSVGSECTGKLAAPRLPPSRHLTEHWTCQQPGTQTCAHLGRRRSQWFSLCWPSASGSSPHFSCTLVLAGGTTIWPPPV